MSKKKTSSPKKPAKRTPTTTPVEKRVFESAAPETPVPDMNTRVLNGRDRMSRYRRNPPCPRCDTHPSVCMMRRPGYASFRCRQCGYRWEVK